MLRRIAPLHGSGGARGHRARGAGGDAGADPAGQRLDAKVLLLSADGTEPGFAAWKYQLTREGVPFDAVVSYTGAAKTSTLTDARLADYGAQHAKYDAVILATGDLGHQVANANGTTSLPLRAHRR